MEKQVRKSKIKNIENEEDFHSKSSVIQINHDQIDFNNDSGPLSSKIKIDPSESDKLSEQRQSLRNTGEHLFKQYRQILILLNNTVAKQQPSLAEVFPNSEEEGQELMNWQESTIYSHISAGRLIANKIDELIRKKKQETVQLQTNFSNLEKQNIALMSKIQTIEKQLRKEISQREKERQLEHKKYTNLEKQLQQSNEENLNLKRQIQNQETQKPKSSIISKGMKNIKDYKTQSFAISTGIILFVGGIYAIKKDVIDFKKFINKFS